jgi:membrane protein YqaA with SNARE-associated domain
MIRTMNPAFDSLRAFVAAYGYWAVALALLGESTGIPLPGEITLLVASFLAFSEHRLHLGWIILVATCATTIGGELGYVVGYYGGRSLLDRYKSFFGLSKRTLARGEKIFARYGAAATFFARFIFGMRVCRPSGGRPAHALEGVYDLQLSGRGSVGHIHRKLRLSFRTALAPAASHNAALQSRGSSHRGDSDLLFVAEIPPRSASRKLVSHCGYNCAYPCH